MGKKKKKKAKKGKAAEEEAPKAYTTCVVFYAKSYLPWQEAALKTLAEIGFDENWLPKEKPAVAFKAKEEFKTNFKNVMQFVNFVCKEVKVDESLSPLETETSFDEKELLEENREFIFGELKMETIRIVEKEEEMEGDLDESKTRNQRDGAKPGKPVAFFF